MDLDREQYDAGVVAMKALMQLGKFTERNYPIGSHGTLPYRSAVLDVESPPLRVLAVLVKLSSLAVAVSGHFASYQYTDGTWRATVQITRLLTAAEIDAAEARR